MSKIIATAAATLVALGALTACGGGGDSSAPAETGLPTVPVESASPSPTSAVDAYCQQVQEYAQQLQDVAASPSPGADAELKTKAQQLQDTANQLSQELTDDPTQMSKVQECTTQLQEALAG